MLHRALVVASIGVLAACSRPAESRAATEAVAPASAQTSARREGSPEALALAARIEAEGAESVVQDLTGPPTYDGLTPVFEGIATGAPEWLALVPGIEPLTDGEYAEGLQAAMSQALSVNTAGVLALLPEYGSYYFVCTDAPASARPLVAAVTDPALQAARTECLSYIDGTAPEVIEMNAAAEE